MNWKRTARWSWLILPFLLLAIWPRSVGADPIIPPGSNAVLYEVTENLKLRPLLAGRRIATSALMGTVNAGTSICPDLLAKYLGVTACSLNAMGSSNVSLADGKGRFEGTFEVVINTPDTNPVDGPELVILQGTFHGRIDFSQAIFSRVPIGFLLNGRWSAKGVAGGLLQGVRAHGTLTGTFRQPFIFPDAGVTSPLYMFDPINFPHVGTYAPVDDSELSLTEPTVRMEINFVETHHHDDD